MDPNPNRPVSKLIAPVPQFPYLPTKGDSFIYLSRLVQIKLARERMQARLMIALAIVVLICVMSLWPL